MKLRLKQHLNFDFLKTQYLKIVYTRHMLYQRIKSMYRFKGILKKLNFTVIYITKTL